NSQAAGPARCEARGIDHGYRGVGTPVAWIQLDRFLEAGNSLRELLRAPAAIMLPPAQEHIVSCRYAGFRLGPGNLVAACQSKRQGIGDAPRHPVLQREDLRQ